MIRIRREFAMLNIVFGVIVRPRYWAVATRVARRLETRAAHGADAPGGDRPERLGSLPGHLAADRLQPRSHGDGPGGGP